MHINDLLLTKEELPIWSRISFKVPIHPALTNPDINLNPDLAKNVFPLVVDEWYAELKSYASSLKDKERRKWIKETFLKKKPVVAEKFRKYILNPLSWESHVMTSENGFAFALGIERDYGGTLYFHITNPHTTFVSLNTNNKYIQFSRDKALAYRCKEKIDKSDFGESVEVYIYDEHNIYEHPGALFLRNWAILYLNEAMKSVFG